jgi:O-antigen/teichoic acid export membrane protein
VNDPQSAGSASSQRVARNTLILMLGQVLGLPMAVATNVFLGRKLGPEEYGQYYLLTTFASLAFMFVDWGLGATLPARIAQDRSSAGRVLGSALVWNLIGTLLTAAVLMLLLVVRGEQSTLVIAMALVCLGQGLALGVRLCTDAVRGFERTKAAALAQMGTQVLTALLVVPVLFMGGRLNAALLAIAAASLIVLFFVQRTLRPVGIGALRANIATAREMLQSGTSFLLFGVVIYLQPTIDAWFLNHYASPQAIGWYAAARKLANPLIFPVTALVGALYPTLCRLWVENRSEYNATAQGALRAALIITVPVAVGCVMFADLGVLLYNREAYGPAIDNVRVMGAILFLIYISSVVGTSLNAAGRQRASTVVQLASLLIIIVLDPLLIPWFQEHHGNGGLGANFATVASEIVMVVANLSRLPKGTLDRSLVPAVGKALAAGAAMAGFAWALSSLSMLLVAPLSVLVYGAVLWAIGGIDPQQLAMLRAVSKRGKG